MQFGTHFRHDFLRRINILGVPDAGGRFGAISQIAGAGQAAEHYFMRRARRSSLILGIADSHSKGEIWRGQWPSQILMTPERPRQNVKRSRRGALADELDETDA